MGGSYTVALTKYVQPAVTVLLYINDQPKTIVCTLRVVGSNQLYKVAYVCVATMVMVAH